MVCGDVYNDASRHRVAEKEPVRQAETAIDRRDFGVTWNAAMDTGAAYLGERVQISLAILAVRQN